MNHPPAPYHLEMSGYTAPKGLKSKLNTVYCSWEQQDRLYMFRQEGGGQHLPLGKKHSRRAGFLFLGLEQLMGGATLTITIMQRKPSGPTHFPTGPVRFRGGNCVLKF